MLCVVLDGAAFGDDPEAKAGALFEAGADWIQLRDRQLEGGALLALARALVAARDAIRATRAAAGAPTLRVIVNRRGDVARAVGADGVQLGFDALPPAAARLVAGADALLGGSLHSADEVTAAARAGLFDYAQLAPIWDPVSKPATRPALGLEMLRAAAQAGLPLLAQGGVDPARAAEAVAAGAAGVAVSGALARGADPQAILRPLRSSLEKVRR